MLMLVNFVFIEKLRISFNQTTCIIKICTNRDYGYAVHNTHVCKIENEKCTLDVERISVCCVGAKACAHQQ